jgi:hypothetical protein
VLTSVSSVHGASTGQVELLWDGRVLAVRTLADGRAGARVPARWVTRGRHHVEVRYLGSATDAPSGASARTRVR